MKALLYIVWVLNASAPPVVAQTPMPTMADCMAASKLIVADRATRIGGYYSPEIKVMACLQQ